MNRTGCHSCFSSWSPARGQLGTTALQLPSFALSTADSQAPTYEGQGSRHSNYSKLPLQGYVPYRKIPPPRRGFEPGTSVYRMRRTTTVLNRGGVATSYQDGKTCVQITLALAILPQKLRLFVQLFI